MKASFAASPNQQRFRDLVVDLFDRILATQVEPIDRAARWMSDAIAQGELVYVFGSGHSSLIALEACGRAEGLAAFEIIHDPTFGNAERLVGYGKMLFNQYSVGPGSVVLIISNSGRNPTGVEIALESRLRGAETVSITSLQFSQAVQSRHPSGRRLYEVCDLVIDNCCPVGEGVIQFDPGGVGGCSVSTLAGIIIIQNLNAVVIEKLAVCGVEVPLLESLNLEGPDERNNRVLARYAGRTRGI